MAKVMTQADARIDVATYVENLAQIGRASCRERVSLVV